MTDTGAGTPLTAAGRALSARLAYDDDPPSYLPGDYLREYRAAIVAIEQEAMALARPATDPAGLDAPCERSEGGLLCDSHDGAYWPSLANRCNGWVALVAARLSVADGPGPEERPDLTHERLARAILVAAREDDRRPTNDGFEWYGSADDMASDILTALSRPLPENREEPSR